MIKRLISLFLCLLVLPCEGAARWRVWNNAVVLASFSDNFTRTNENPLTKGGAWTNGIGAWTGLQVSSNKAAGQTASADNGALVITPLFASNQKATATVDQLQLNAVLLRFNSSGNGYFLYIESSTSLKLFRSDAFVNTQLGAAFTVSLTAGDTVALGAVGSTLTVYVNGASQGTRTDSTYTSGQPGLWIFSQFNTVAAFAAVDQ